MFEKGAERAVNLGQLATVLVKIHGLFLLAQPFFFVLGFLILLRGKFLELDAPAYGTKPPSRGNQGAKQAEQNDNTRRQRPQARILGIQRLEILGQSLKVNQWRFGCSRFRFGSLLFRQPLGGRLSLQQR